MYFIIIIIITFWIQYCPRRRSWPDFVWSLSLPRLAILFDHMHPLSPVYFSLSHSPLASDVIIRGGVEDTRLEVKAKDSLSEDRHSRGQGQECSRPRPRTKDTSASALQKKKRSSQKFFERSPRKHVFQKIFQALHKILTIQKLVLSSSRGQANFRGLEASRPRPRTSKCVLEAKDVLEDSTSGDYQQL